MLRTLRKTRARGSLLFFERLCFFGLSKERLGVGVKTHSTARNFPHRPKEALYTWGLCSPKPRTFFSLQRQKKAKAPPAIETMLKMACVTLNFLKLGLWPQTAKNS